MGAKRAGLLMFCRAQDGEVEILLVHPGGPFWVGKDAGAWTIPEGVYDETEPAHVAAKRELIEETGLAAVEPFIELGSLRQPSGKCVSIWAFESDCDPAKLVSNTFETEWPRRSGRRSSFPEIDRAGVSSR